MSADDDQITEAERRRRVDGVDREIARREQLARHYARQLRDQGLDADEARLVARHAAGVP